MLAPCAPFTFLACFHIVKEDSSCRHIHGIIVDFKAHDNDPSTTQPGHFLHMSCLQNVLLFFCQFQLPLEVIEGGDIVHCHFILEDDGEVLRVIGELEGIERLVGMRFVSFDLDLLLECPHDEIFATASVASIGSDDHPLIGRELSICSIQLRQQPLILQRATVIDVSALGSAYCEIVAQGRKYEFVDGVVNGEEFRGQCVFGALIEVVEPIEIGHVGFADDKLTAVLFIEVVVDLLRSGGEAGRLEGAVQDVLLLLLNEPPDFVDGEALQSVVFVELEVVELGEGSLRLRIRTVCDVQGLIAYSILAANLNAHKSLLLANLLRIEQLGLEEREELLFVIRLEHRNAVDWIETEVLMN